MPKSGPPPHPPPAIPIEDETDLTELTERHRGTDSLSVTEFDAQKELQKQYERVSGEYIEMTSLVRELRDALERKNTEVQKLNSEIRDLMVENKSYADEYKAELEKSRRPG